MRKIAIALALSLAATTAFAQTPTVGSDVTTLAPGGTTGLVVGQTVVIAGVGTATVVAIGGTLFLILAVVAGGNGGSVTPVTPVTPGTT